MKFHIVLFITFLAFAAQLQAQDAEPPLSGNSASLSPALSAEGRFVAFASDASNMVIDDTNETTDVFVRDRETGETSRVSVASDGTQGDDYSRAPDISGDGRYVVFESAARNLVKNDDNNSPDIFVHDRETGQTRLVSAASDGEQGDLSSHDPKIAGDGTAVIFWTNAGNFMDADTNFYRDVFVHHLETGKTTRVSVSSERGEANEDSFNADISDDGRIAVFWSRASNLVADDTNGMEDIFVHDLETGETTRVNVASDGTQANGYTFEKLSISGDGRFVAFQSQATNLVSEETDDRNQIFVHDRETGQTTRVSVPTRDIRTLCDDFCLGSSEPSISGDGRFIVFTSDLTGLVNEDTNGAYDVFLHDQASASTVRVSVNSDDAQLDSSSDAGVTSANGRFIAFETGAALVFSDFNFTTDVYIYDRETRDVTLVSAISSE